MTATCIRCQVLEMPKSSEAVLDRGDWPRDLLPWADPYIARLICRLEERYEAATLDDGGRYGPVAEDDELYLDAYRAEWEDDAFLPRALEPTRDRWFPPVYGGFPLLNDTGP
jgi:hypothetical protein